MNETEKLRVLLPHWIEHNSGHETECLKWAEIARGEGQESIADTIEAAIKKMREGNKLLQKALEEAGGPADKHDHHHDHHHH